MFHVVRTVSVSLIVATLATAAAVGVGLFASRRQEQQYANLGS